MIKFENVDVHGFEAAIRGMRNPLESWDKSDSWFEWYTEDDGYTTVGRRISGDDNRFRDYDLAKWQNDAKVYIGSEDHNLMMCLAKAGSEHAKFRRMINVTVDITAPLYWWKEFDTYKVGTVANSCSTMHCIHKKEFELSDFSFENVEGRDEDFLINFFLNVLNTNREKYLETKDKKYWWQMIQLLPTSYNQKRTVQMNYEVLANIYRQRQGHKLDEWNDFISWIETLPYKEVICG